MSREQPRRVKGSDGRVKEKSKDELTATSRKSRRTGGGAKMLQPLAEHPSSDSVVAARAPTRSAGSQPVLRQHGCSMFGTEALEELSLALPRQLASAIPGATRRKRDSDGKIRENPRWSSTQ